MNGTAPLADHLESRSDEIIAAWRTVVARGRDVPASQGLSHDAFADHIPGLIDRMAERLRGRPADVAAEGRNHARDRWGHGYDLTDFVRELGHLRTALVRATFDFARRQDYTLDELEAAWEAINDVLHEANAEAVDQFRAERSEELNRVLGQLEERQHAVQEAWLATESERAKLRTILDQLPVGVWVADARGTIIGVNREAARLLGRPEAEAFDRAEVQGLGTGCELARPDGTAYGPDEVPLRRALRGEVVAQEEILWRAPGGVRAVLINAAPLVAGRAVRGAVAVVHDVTARREAEQKLRRQLDFTRTITETMGEGLYALDPEGLPIYMNPAAERMLGWTLAELRERALNMHEAIHHRRPDGSPFPAEGCPLWTSFRGGTPRSGDDVFIRKDGTGFPVAYTMTPMVSDGQVVGAVMTFSDITERKRLEADLEHSEERFRVIAEQSPVMIWRSGLDGGCDYFNRAWYEFRGRTPEQERGDGWTAGVHPDDLDRCVATYRAAFARREPYEVMYRLLRHDGQYRWISARGTPCRDASGAFLGYLGSCLDITPRIELEAALEQQRELAEEASQHKSRLLSALSHDARTPLNAVVLSAQLLEASLDGQIDPEVAQCLRTIRHSVGNVLDLLGDLLNLTKIDAGALPAEVSRFPVEPVLAESLSSIETQARLKGLEVRVEPDGLADAVLETDRAKLKQILCNLLSNALRHTDSGHILIRAGRDADEIRFAVEDTGVGIDPADHRRIFDEFATLGHAHRPQGEGTGLGLAICRRLANLLRGEITLRSAPGRGSTFTLVLPAEVLVGRSSEEIAVAPAAEASAPGGVVLIAEDHLTSRQTLAKVLRRMGYRALEAGNGRDVLALVERERPLAVLMDVNMPVMDGIDATLALRADPRFRDLPIFALTGDISLVNQRRIGEAGVDGYLEKPVTWDVLQATLSSLNGRRR